MPFITVVVIYSTLFFFNFNLDSQDPDR